MASFEDYWEGRVQAHLDQSQIDARWGQPGVSWVSQKIAFVNQSFDIYYQAINNIKRTPDWAHRWAMLKELHDAAKTGYGIGGPDDLEEAFEHLEKNNGRWTSNRTKTYFGGRGKIFDRLPNLKTAKSAVEFINAVERKMRRLKRVLNKYEEHLQMLDQATRNTGAEDWERVGTVLGEIKEWGERAKPFLWTAPVWERRAGRAITFVDVLGNIQGGLTEYYLARMAGFPKGQAAAVGGMKVAAGLVPVLGGYYAMAVSLIPALKVSFQEGVDSYHRRISDRARFWRK